MALLSRDIGTPSGDAKQDIRELYDYIAYLTEQLEYSNRLLEKRVKTLEKQMKALEQVASTTSED